MKSWHVTDQYTFMVNPGAFRGSRKAFLIEQKPSYKAAVLGGFAAECICDIQRRFFKRYPIHLGDNEEPSEEDLAKVDDNAPDLDTAPPDPEMMSSEEYQKTITAFDNKRKRNARIKAVGNIPTVP